MMRKPRLSAAALLAPATLAVSLVLLLPLVLMFRYSLNRFEPGRFMVEALGLAPATIMYTPWAVLVGIVSVNLPFVTLTVESVIEGIDAALGEAAASLGATPFAAWRLVTLPLAVPGLLAAGALSFILTMNAYATPLLLGGPRFQMIGPTLAREILNQANWPFGASLAFVLIAFTLASTAFANVLIARAMKQ